MLLLLGTAWALDIRFDYRDDGYFSAHPERRATLEAAAAMWGALIADDFAAVAARREPRLHFREDGASYRGTEAKTRSGRTCQRWTSQEPHEHTRTPERYPKAGLGDHNHCRNPDGEAGPWCYTTDPDKRWEYCAVGALSDAEIDRLPPIDDLLIVVTAKPIESKAYAAAIAPDTGDAELEQRFRGVPYQPWIGRMTFDSEPDRPWFFDPTPATSDDIPSATHYDFLTTALHEIGHILGYLPMIPAFHGQLRDGAFHGERTVAFLGEPLPIDGGHIQADVTAVLARPHLENQLMGTHDPIQGLRQIPSRLDAAVLSDLGYSIDPEVLAGYHPEGRPATVLADPEPDPREPSALWKGAAAVWAFDDPRYRNSAQRGIPLLYSAPPGKPGPLSMTKKGARVPTGGFFYAEHGQSAANCDHPHLACWSLVVDLHVDADVTVALFNTNPDNRNDADGFLDKAHLGFRERSKPVATGLRRIAVVARRDRLHWFADGKPMLDEPIDPDRHSLTIGKRPFFVLFGDPDGRDGPVDVQHIVFYAEALSDEAVAKLGSY